MKTKIGKIEITPRLGNILNKWCENTNDSNASNYHRWLGKVQDCLTRELVNRDSGDKSFSALMEAIDMVIVIKDDIEEFIPQIESAQ